MDNLVLDSPPQVPSRRRSARLSSRTMGRPTSSEAHLTDGLNQYPSHDSGTRVEEDPWSPVNNADCAIGSEGINTQRKRRPRISYSNLTEKEKYQRIRDLNNEASRHYRERTREQLMTLQQREVMERQRNTVLKAKVAGLERLRKEIEDYTHTFFREHIGNQGVQ